MKKSGYKLRRGTALFTPCNGHRLSANMVQSSIQAPERYHRESIQLALEYPETQVNPIDECNHQSLEKPKEIE
jgi:hypothetical protein